MAKINSQVQLPKLILGQTRLRADPVQALATAFRCCQLLINHESGQSRLNAVTSGLP